MLTRCLQSLVFALLKKKNFFFWAGLIVNVLLIKINGTSAVSADFTNAFELE